ncbi:MAG: hypothetical protein ACXVJT_00400 [Thermoanaerobaculia bacterium]
MNEPAKRVTSLQAWMPRLSGAALILFFVATSVFRISGLYTFFGVLAFLIGGTLFYRYAARQERKRLGLPMASAMSDRVMRLAMELRARATVLDDRFGRKHEPMSDLAREDLDDLSRVARLRRYDNVVEAIRSIDTDDAMKLRTRAEELERFAASIRGRATSYHLTKWQLIRSAIVLGLFAAGGAFLIYDDAESRGTAFNVGVGLVAFAVIGALVLFLMQTERD